MIVEGDKNRMTFTLRPDGSPRTEIESKEPNLSKIRFGIVSDGHNKLELCSYDSVYHQNAFIFLNGERIMLDKFHVRKLWSSISKMGYFLGVSRKRGNINGTKK